MPELKRDQDNNEISIEAELAGEKGFYDVPVSIRIYGTTDRAARLDLENRLKADRLLKATDLKRTRTESDLQRQQAMMNMGPGQSNVGLDKRQAEPEPQVSLEQLTRVSEAVLSRAGGDIVKTLAMDENSLSQMPMAEQPKALSATLLPYQLQVREPLVRL